MRYVKNRIHISALELDQIAKCPQSINHLEKIYKSKACDKCSIFSKLARYTCQRAFRGGNQPSISTLTKRYKTILINEKSISKTEADRIVRKETIILHDLLDLGLKLSQQIDNVGQSYELHFGRYTIEDDIDLVLYNKNLYILVDFACADSHPEFLFHYRALASSLWMRENYDIEVNALSRINLGTDDRPKMEVKIIDIDTAMLNQVIRYAVEEVDLGPITLPEDVKKLEETRVDLPAIFGEHCSVCLACF